jgi:hypothetical protein
LIPAHPEEIHATGLVVNPPRANIDYVGMINAKDPRIQKWMGWHRILIAIVGVIKDDDITVRCGYMQNILGAASVVRGVVDTHNAVFINSIVLEKY